MTQIVSSLIDTLAAVALPPPVTSGGGSLRDALLQRRSVREFSDRPLTQQMLSDLLWAADGVNRAAGGRTAPSARNWQEIDIYAATAAGLFRYEPEGHRLHPVLSADVRAHTGLQDFVTRVPLNLIYVADLGRVSTADDSERRFYSGADAGFIAQNVYLFCASEGLATVVRGLVDRPEMARIMALGPQQRVLLAQSIGYPVG